jgi:hypothetical protein
MDCPDCNKTLNSDTALMQHYLNKHGKHLCTECFKTFWSAASLEQHSDSKHTTIERYDSHSHDDPYPGIAGYWIPRNKFKGNSKSFGWFECDSCTKTWFSAHAHKRFKQGCQVCEEESFPCCLWVNTSYNNDKDSANMDKSDRPHDRARCEACRKGQCIEC